MPRFRCWCFIENNKACCHHYGDQCLL